MGIGFAIPARMIRSIHEQLKAKGKVTRGFLGINIQDLDDKLAGSFGLKEARGILVAHVVPGSPAADGGVQSGDVILELDGSPVPDADGFRHRVALTAPGSSLRLKVQRKDRELTLTLEVGNREDSAGRAGSGDEVAAALGFEVQDLDDKLARRFGYQPGEGVLVSGVDPGSEAARAGLRPGALVVEVNRTPVRSVADLRTALGQVAKGNSVLLLVRDGDGGRYLVLTP